MLTLLRAAGFRLRGADPVAMKAFVLAVHARAAQAAAAGEMTARAEVGQSTCNLTSASARCLYADSAHAGFCIIAHRERDKARSLKSPGAAAVIARRSGDARITCAQGTHGCTPLFVGTSSELAAHTGGCR